MQGAVHYRDSDCNCHVAALDSCLPDIAQRFPEAHIVCCGDCSARTANIQINSHPKDLLTNPANRCLYFITADLVTAQLMTLVNACQTFVHVLTCLFLTRSNMEMKKEILLMSQHMYVAL